MELTPRKKDRGGALLWLMAAGSAFGITLVLYHWVPDTLFRYRMAAQFTASDVGGSMRALFTRDYPANQRFQEELALLRSSGKLEIENEKLIHRAILETSHTLHMPPAILWCLLFQESRLNHLEGLEGEQGARGLGQFSYYSFFEINHHLQQYTSENFEAMVSLLGKDIRPVEPRPTDLRNPSSYFYIPTAVVASAAYLNNRYLQLARILEKKHVVYDPELLWLYATMAYNKGTRSVLAFWNDARRTGDMEQVERLVLERPTLFRSMTDASRWLRALRTIWPSAEADAYAKEIKIHVEKMKECSVAMSDQMRIEGSLKTQARPAPADAEF